MLTKGKRKAATRWARGTNLEGRSKFATGTAKRIAEFAPQFAHLNDRLEELLPGLHAAEGQLLDYDNLKRGRLALEARFKRMDRQTENVLNARLGGSTTPWPENSTIPHAELDQLQDLLERNNVFVNQMENAEFERVGLDSPDNPDVSREEHPRFMSSTSRNPLNTARNLWSILPLAKRPGLNADNVPRMMTAIYDWIDGNASFDGEKVVWREGKPRNWWKSSNGETHSVRIGDVKLNPDNITTQLQFELWKANEPKRLAEALVKESSMLDAENQKLDDHLERALKLPHLGEIVHNISVIDIFRNLERRRRALNAIKKLPDGFFTKLEQLQKDAKAEVSELESIREATAGFSKETKAAAAELADLIKMLEQSIGLRQKGDVGSLTGDAMEVIGRPQFRDMGGITQAMSDADAQLADYMNKALIKYNWASGIRQEGQTLVATLASMDPKGIANYAKSRIKTAPPVSYALGKFGIKTPEVLENTHSMPMRSDAALAGAASKLRDQLRLQAKSTEQIEAATIDGFMATLRDRIQAPTKMQAEYLERVLGRNGADELRAAFAAGDLDGAFEIARPLIIRELDQKNGSGVATSKPAALKAYPVMRLASRLVSTPLTVTGSVLGAKDRYGAQASAHPLASKAAALAILGGGQLISNPLLVSNAKVAGTIAALTGAYGPAAIYFLRDESEEEKIAQGKLETIAAEAKDAAGGDLGAAARLATAATFESIPNKMVGSSELLYGARSRDAAKIGQAAGDGPTRPAFDVLASVFPTTFGIAKMGADAVGSVSDYGISGLVGPRGPLPMFRSAFAAKVDVPNVEIKREPAKMQVSTPNAASLGRKKVKRKTQVTVQE